MSSFVLYDFYKNSINRFVFVSGDALLLLYRRIACVKELEHQLH